MPLCWIQNYALSNIHSIEFIFSFISCGDLGPHCLHSVCCRATEQLRSTSNFWGFDFYGVPSTHHGLHWTASSIKERAVIQGNVEHVNKIFIHMNTFMIQKETRESVERHDEEEVQVSKNTVLWIDSKICDNTKYSRSTLCGTRVSPPLMLIWPPSSSSSRCWTS